MKKTIIAAILLCAPATANDSPSGHTLPERQQLYDEWRYSGAIRSGDHIYVSGVVGSMRDGETTPEAAFVRAFDNIGATLKLAGADWNDVVDITSFNTDVASQIVLFRQVKDRYIVTKPYPAWTAVGVSRLIPDKGVVEIKVVARISN
jgi:enamine deaminase RidA (YjgF/YER057c/UK114 family)